jgi:lysophospholipase L1-like esterase
MSELSAPAPFPARDRRWRRYVALGDSLTEGLCDPSPPGSAHPWRGWADRVAEGLAGRADAAGEPFEYANLAVRGRLLHQIVAEQVPVAIEQGADLVSLVGGGNDVLRPGVDVDAVTELLEGAVVRLVDSGATVLLSTSYDPRLAPLVRRTRGLAAVFAANVWSVARRRGAVVLDLWGMRALQDPRMWAEDRIHLTAEGHRRVAAQALDLLGVGGEEGWATPLDPTPARSRGQAWRQDAAWVRGHVVPWVGRRLRGRSSGDGLTAKRRVPAPVVTVGNGSSPGVSPDGSVPTG